MTSPAGGVILWKPSGLSSRAALECVERQLRVQRLGHAGTLDPLASGLLILLCGEARKFQNLFMGHAKEYHARVVLGMLSHSEDGEGPLWSVVPRPGIPDRRTIQECVEGFVGEYRHIPPRLSAVRVGGQRSYKRARRGEVMDPEPRTVTVHGIEVRAWRPPLLELHIACEAGTYIRSLVRDLGEALGTGAFMAGLRRTAVGPFLERDAKPLHRITDDDVLPLEDLLRHLPAMNLDDESARLLGNGLKIAGPSDLEGYAVAWCGGRVHGLVEACGRLVRPRRWVVRDGTA